MQSLSSWITILTQTITDKNFTTSSPLSTEPCRKKCKIKNLTLFNSKKSLIKK